jgi:hypothetical protein
MNVCMSAQLYRRRNHASQAIPSPEATLLVATALRAYESTLNIESGDIDFQAQEGSILRSTPSGDAFLVCRATF